MKDRVVPQEDNRYEQAGDLRPPQRQKHLQEVTGSIKPFSTWQEVADIHLPYPRPTLRISSFGMNKKRNYYLITVKGNKRVDLKAFRQQNDTRPLTFASDQDLMDMLGLIPGAVTPLGLLNDREHKVTFWLDKSFLESSGLIGVHPNDNTATVWLKTQDLLRLLEENGTQITLFEA